MKENKWLSLTMVLLSYVLAATIGIFVYHQTLTLGFVWAILLGDIAATIVIYVIGLFLRNASLYDPYWSVQPMFILALVAMQQPTLHFGTLLLLIVVFLWGLRLTGNWIYTFENLTWQDWRYTMLNEKTGELYPLVNLLGIHLFPTLVVFGVITPGILFIQSPVFNVWTMIGAMIVLVGFLLELFADIQMQTFRKARKSKDEIIRIGLWKHARHPNYLGEILVWFGVYVFLLSSQPSLWYFGAGAVINTLMFVFISMPMAEKRLRLYKPNFDQYVGETHLLLPFKK